MTETKDTTHITAEDVKAWREKLRAYRAAKVAAAAARKARREERAEEYGQHKMAEDDAQSRIDTLNAEADAQNKRLTTLRDNLGLLRVEIQQATQARKIICFKLDTAYTDRAAARCAIARLNAEIRGEDGDE